MKSMGLITHEWSLKRQIPVEFFPSVDSTSNYAKSLMNDPLENHHALHLVVADTQTAGRGRGTNTWINGEPGTSLLSTWSFRVTRPPQPITSARMGLALYKAVTKVWPEAAFSLKAPNDLYLQDKKVGGLLLEAIEQGPHIRLLVGLGINVQSSPALEIASSLYPSIDEELIFSNWDVFLDEVYKGLQGACDQVSSQLNSWETEELLEALNKWPLLEQPYTAVQPDGSLQTGSFVTHWSDL